MLACLLASWAGVSSPAGYARLYYLRAAIRARLTRTGKDSELVLKLAGLPEGVVVGVEGRAAQLDGAPQDVAGCGVDVAYLLCGEGAAFARGMDAGGEEDLVHVDVAETGHDGLVEEQAFYARLAVQGGGQVFDGDLLGERVGPEA